MLRFGGNLNRDIEPTKSSEQDSWRIWGKGRQEARGQTNLAKDRCTPLAGPKCPDTRFAWLPRYRGISYFIERTRFTGVNVSAVGVTLRRTPCLLCPSLMSHRLTWLGERSMTSGLEARFIVFALSSQLHHGHVWNASGRDTGLEQPQSLAQEHASSPRLLLQLSE
jgi:hypothetical protein